VSRHLSAAVIGHPVSHSKSPLIHGYWLRTLGLAGDYTRIDVAPDDLGTFIAALSASGLRGVNVTIPHKQAVMPFCATLSAAATFAGAVNTVIVQPDGTLHGDNTDVAGIMVPLAAQDWTDKTAVIIGNGGAARAALLALKMLNVGTVRGMARRVSDLANLLAGFGFDPAQAFGLWQADASLAGADLLINATSLGMTGQPPLTIDLSPLNRQATVFDVVYAPLETPLLQQAKALGHCPVDGLTMLVEQAAAAFQLFFGQSPPRSAATDTALRKALTA
jgi:shikimate dehydrogenase